MMGNNTKIQKKQNTLESLVYVATPQRLDQNTSGLVVVATTKSFASYFAKLLRNKTDIELKADSSQTVDGTTHSIKKKYRCLVCIKTGSSKSIDCELLIFEI